MRQIAKWHQCRKCRLISITNHGLAINKTIKMRLLFRDTEIVEISGFERKREANLLRGRKKRKYGNIKPENARV